MTFGGLIKTLNNLITIQSSSQKRKMGQFNPGHRVQRDKPRLRGQAASAFHLGSTACWGGQGVGELRRSFNSKWKSKVFYVSPTLTSTQWEERWLLGRVVHRWWKYSFRRFIREVLSGPQVTVGRSTAACVRTRGANWGLQAGACGPTGAHTKSPDKCKLTKS